MSNETPEKIRGAIASEGMKYPVSRVGDAALGAFAVRYVPTAFLIDRSGELTWTGLPRSITDEQLDELLQ